MAVTLQRYVKRAILSVPRREEDGRGRELQRTTDGFECSCGGRLVSAARWSDRETRSLSPPLAAVAVPLNTRFKDTFPN